MLTLRRRCLADESGFSVAETLVALVIVGIVASAFLGLLVTTMGASRANEARVAANQIAQDYLEKVIENPWSSIGLYSTDSGYQATTASGESTVTLTTSPRPANVPSPLVSTTVKGVSYSIRTDVGWYDDPSDGTGAADANGNTNDIKHVVVTVSWTRNGTPFSVSVNDYRAPTATEVPPTVSTGGLSVTVTAPSSQTLSTTGYFGSTMTINATTSKSASSVTVTYNTRTGAQTVAMTGSGTSWSLSLGTGTGPFDTGSTAFSVSATAGSNNATGKATVTMVGPGNSAPTISVTAAPSQTLSGIPGTLGTAISLSLSASSSASSVSVTYPTHASPGGVTQSLSGSGTSWSFTVPVDATTYNVGYETFSFTATFSGGTTRTGFATINLYDPAIAPDVTNLVVNSPFTAGGTTQGFCIKSNNYTLFSTTTVDATVKNVASTDSVVLSAPNISSATFPMSYQSTKADGSMVFRYSVASGSVFPNASSLLIKADAVKTISGTQYSDDFVATVPVQRVNSSNSCT